MDGELCRLCGGDGRIGNALGHSSATCPGCHGSGRRADTSSRFHDVTKTKPSHYRAEVATPKGPKGPATSEGVQLAMEVSASVVLAADAAHYYEEIEQRRPFPTLHDLAKMYLNGLTSSAFEAIKIPIVLDSDRQAMQVALHAVGHGHDARVAVVRSTLELDELWVSEALADEVATNPRLERLGAADDLEFTAEGRLVAVSQRRAMAHVPSSS